MNAEEINSDDGIIVAEELPQQLRVAEGSGDQGEWVAWAGGDRKLVRIIALDDEAFYAKAEPLDRAAELVRQLREGAPPSVVLGKGRVIPFNKITAMHIEEKAGRLAFTYIALTGAERWDQKGFSVNVLHDVLEELAKRMPDGKRWQRTYTPRRAALYPLVALLVTAILAATSYAMVTGHLDDASPGSSWKSRLGKELIAAVGPVGVLVIGAAIMIGQCIWMVRSVRNPPIMAGIKPKGTLWGKSKKQPKT